VLAADAEARKKHFWHLMSSSGLRIGARNFLGDRSLPSEIITTVSNLPCGDRGNERGADGWGGGGYIQVRHKHGGGEPAKRERGIIGGVEDKILY
jgi:hypothetical protein